MKKLLWVCICAILPFSVASVFAQQRKLDRFYQVLWQKDVFNDSSRKPQDFVEDAHDKFPAGSQDYYIHTATTGQLFYPESQKAQPVPMTSVSLQFFTQTGPAEKKYLLAQIQGKPEYGDLGGQIDLSGNDSQKEIDRFLIYLRANGVSDPEKNPLVIRKVLLLQALQKGIEQLPAFIKLRLQEKYTKDTGKDVKTEEEREAFFQWGKLEILTWITPERILAHTMPGEDNKGSAVFFANIPSEYLSQREVPDFHDEKIVRETVVPSYFLPAEKVKNDYILVTESKIVGIQADRKIKLKTGAEVELSPKKAAVFAKHLQGPGAPEPVPAAKPAAAAKSLPAEFKIDGKTYKVVKVVNENPGQKVYLVQLKDQPDEQFQVHILKNADAISASDWSSFQQVMTQQVEAAKKSGDMESTAQLKWVDFDGLKGMLLPAPTPPVVFPAEEIMKKDDFVAGSLHYEKMMELFLSLIKEGIFFKSAEAGKFKWVENLKDWRLDGGDDTDMVKIAGEDIVTCYMVAKEKMKAKFPDVYKKCYKDDSEPDSSVVQLLQEIDKSKITKEQKDRLTEFFKDLRSRIESKIKSGDIDFKKAPDDQDDDQDQDQDKDDDQDQDDEKDDSEGKPCPCKGAPELLPKEVKVLAEAVKEKIAEYYFSGQYAETKMLPARKAKILSALSKKQLAPSTKTSVPALVCTNVATKKDVEIEVGQIWGRSQKALNINEDQILESLPPDYKSNPSYKKTSRFQFVIGVDATNKQFVLKDISLNGTKMLKKAKGKVDVEKVLHEDRPLVIGSSFQFMGSEYRCHKP